MAFDVISPIKMGQGEIQTSVGTLYTTPVDQRDILKTMDIANGNAAATRVTVYLVPSGDAPSVDNVLVPSVEVPGYGIFQWSGAQVMNEGDTIRAVAVLTGVTFTASGGGAV